MIARVVEVSVWEILTLAWLFIGLHTALSWVEWRLWGAKPWWRTALGWILASAVASLGIVFAFLAAAMLWPTLALHAWYQWAYVLSFQAVAGALAGKTAWRTRAHVKARRAHAREYGQGERE